MKEDTRSTIEKSIEKRNTQTIRTAIINTISTIWVNISVIVMMKSVTVKNPRDTKKTKVIKINDNFTKRY